MGNAEEIIDPDENQVAISNTSFVNNTKYALFNRIANTIDATDNWWGTTTGPTLTRDTRVVGNTVYGPVNAMPWLLGLPEDTSNKAICCSNVLFIPGFQASRLYKDEKRPFGTSTNSLWEPYLSAATEDLFLDSTGQSINKNIYTKDIIDKAYSLGAGAIYSKFIATMNGMVAEKKINNWMTFPYDWRENIEDVVNNPTQLATSTQYLVDTVLKLAETSATGKVTIVAHSNGGLVAKMLGKALEQAGKIGVLDKVIFVAVPQFGTPQAIAGLLHGDGQSILGGIFLSKSTARTFGLNMPGAYGLLPSLEYFKHILKPVITVVSGTTSSSTILNSYKSVAGFLTGVYDGRAQPDESNTDFPAVLNTNLLSQTGSSHEKVDGWNFPSTVSIVSIAGWGMPTTETLSYIENSNQDISGSLMKTSLGDGTVLTAIASGYGSEQSTSTQVFFDQKTADEIGKDKVTHGDILQAASVSQAVSVLVSTTSKKIDLPAFMSYDYPDVSKVSYLIISVHSPVDLDVYSEDGGHVGVVPSPIPGSDLMWLDSTIPNSDYYTFAGGKYVTVPAEGKYSVRLKGTGVGTFTYRVEQLLGEDYVASTTFTDLPVTPLLVASSTVQSLVPLPWAPQTQTEGDGASSTPKVTLTLDVDGDGTSDIDAKPSDSFDPIVHLDALRIIVSSLHLDSSLEQPFLARIDQAEKFVEFSQSKIYPQNGLPDFLKKAQKSIKKLEKISKEKHWSINNISESDRQELLRLIDIILSNFETV